MIAIITFIVGLYLGTELQAWWHRSGAKKFVDWQNNVKKKGDI